jgi:serine/threonine protein kinase
MTSVGLVLGSPAYIAPEVAAGQPVTPAADLWGLGATLFAAVEGRPPYDVHGDPVSTITEVVDGEVPRPRGSGPVADVIAALMVKDPARRMPLEEVRQRLRPLIDDPDDPLYPGSPDAPTMEAAAITRPPVPPAPPRHSATASTRIPATAPRHAAPLAADPGPLPGRAPHPRTDLPAEASPWRSTGLVVAGAAVVLAGILGGWGVTRSVGGQSPFTPQNVTTASAPTTLDRDALGFTIPVPTGWTRRASTDSVAFVSDNGTEDLTVTRVAKTEDAETVPGTEIVDPPAPSAGNTESLSYRTDTRTSWRRIVPASGTVWVITLTVPRSAAGAASEKLFQSLAGGFSTTA